MIRRPSSGAMLLTADRKQPRVIMRYVEGFLEGNQKDQRRILMVELIAEGYWEARGTVGSHLPFTL